MRSWVDEVVVIAAEAGFVVTKAEVLQVQAQSVELSDEELEGVAGGIGGAPTQLRGCRDLALELQYGVGCVRFTPNATWFD